MTSKSLLAAAAVLAATTLTGVAAKANPVYIGYSFTAGGPITQVGNSGADGSASSNGIVSIGNGFSLQISGTGAPIVGQGSLLSNTTSVTSSSGGSLFIYVSETSNTGSMETFTTGFSNDSQSTATVTETTYASSGNTPFAMANLLSTSSVAPGSSQSAPSVSAPAGLSSPFTVTEVYALTLAAGGRAISTLSLTATPTSTPVPEPMTLSLMAGGILALGAVRRRFV